MQNVFIHTIGSRFLSAFFNFLIVLLVARVMGAEGKGQTTIIVSAVSFLLFFANLATGPSLIYLLPRNNSRLLMGMGVLWTLLVHILAYFLMQFFPVIFPNWRIPILIISLLTSLNSINQMIFLARQDFFAANVFNFLQVLMQLIVLLALFYLFKQIGLSAFCYSYYISMGLCFLLSFLFVIPYLRESPPANDISLTHIFWHGLQYQFSELLQFLNMRFSFFILNSIHGATALGIYSVGVSILEFVWLISRSLAQIQYAKISNSGSHSYHIRLTLSFLKFGLVLSFFILLLVLLVPASLYQNVFGPSFYYIKFYMKYLIPGILSYSVFIILSSYFAGKAKIGLNILAGLGGLICTVSLCYLLVPQYSVGGSCAASTISYTVCALILLFFFYRKNKFAASQLLPSRSDIEMVKLEFLKYIKPRT